ncbi:MAG: hypothetical protein LBH17_03645 [Oscillospiraceae bacterium]|jgi:hypothetical protein|nr:hypothetical protein [Oscillospiraceae bacterium]
MQSTFTVTRAGNTLGELSLAQNGAITELNYSGYAPDSENIYRLAAVCAGEYVSLGVPAPSDADGGRFELKKKLSKNVVRELGFIEPSAFELILPGEIYSKAPPAPASPPPITPSPSKPTPPVPPTTKSSAQNKTRPVQNAARLTEKWTPEPNPERLFSDGGAAAITDAVKGALSRRENGIVFLAAPVSEDAPFPMMPVFCFGTPETIDDARYLVFKLKNGALTA